MGHAPLARIEQAIALSLEKDLIIYIEGVTAGFGGGHFTVRRSSEKSIPPTYILEEQSGNPGPLPTGIGTSAPDNIPTRNAFVLVGEALQGFIGIEHASGHEQIRVIEVKPNK